MKTSFSFFAAGLLLQVSKTKGLPQYGLRIPNGQSVPNPGPEGGVWAGVGHLKTGGGGDLNPFGVDFKAAGFQWTEELCRLDSDGDGRTNGEELGDVDCVWFEGQEPAGPAVSHPGIVDEPKALTASNCDDYVAPDDELTMDIAFSTPTQMDETQTHYICEQMVIDAPAQGTLHKIKTAVLLDNPEVLHHMFVFICPTGTTSADGDRVGQGYYACSGNDVGCQRIGGWAVGPHEECEPSNVGRELDFGDATQIVVKIEAHYDNASGKPQQDQSGIRVHMTPTPRPLIASGATLGMPHISKDFVIPALTSSHSLSTICPSVITEKLENAVYAYAFNPHMHLYGRSAVTEHYRCGQKIGEIGRIGAYEFDNQQTYTLDPPVKILPGDSFVTTCVYDTSAVDFEVRGGEETKDEMCLNFLSLYPRPGTETDPSLLGGCFSFENGLVRDGREITQRMAFGGPGITTQSFESDPLANIGACCAVNNCEELYQSLEGEACAVNTDCMDDLICAGGMCEMTEAAGGELRTEGLLPSLSHPLDVSSAVPAAGYAGVIIVFISFFWF